MSSIVVGGGNRARARDQGRSVVNDEREGRVVARQAGLAVRGVLGILLRAKATGKIASVKAEIETLRNRAGVFVAPALEEKILRSAGE